MRKALVVTVCLAVLAMASYHAGGRALMEVLSWYVG